MPSRLIRATVLAMAAVFTFAAAAAAENRIEQLMTLQKDLDSRLVDFSCLSASSSESCAAQMTASTGEPCQWSSAANLCVNNRQATWMQDSALTEEGFWSDSLGCFAASTTSQNCQAAGSTCKFCTLDEPSVSVCLSEATHNKLTALGVQESGALQCGDFNHATGLHDTACLRLNAFAQDTCGKGLDAAGRPCVFVEHYLSSDAETRSMDVGMLCLSQAQEAVLNSFMRGMQSASLKWFLMPESSATDANEGHRD